MLIYQSSSFDGISLQTGTSVNLFAHSKDRKTVQEILSEGKTPQLPTPGLVTTSAHSLPPGRPSTRTKYSGNGRLATS